METCAATCPICGQANDCQLASTNCYKGPCWCARETFPPELLARVPEESRRTACICRSCVTIARRAGKKNRPVPIARAGDFYIEGDHVVFTAQYLANRGYCCGSGCRHCPYDELEQKIALLEKLPPAAAGKSIAL